MLRESIGIDVSKDDFKVCLSVLTSDLQVKVLGSRSFKNQARGFSDFQDWFSNKSFNPPGLGFVMEATGVYHESLAYYLHDKGLRVHVVLPNQSRKYGESLGVKSKTDLLDAGILARLGLERQLCQWRPFSSNFRILKQLCREREAYIHSRTILKNQLHAYTHQGIAVEGSISRSKFSIDLFNKQIYAIGKDIKQILQNDTSLKNRLEYVLSIKGVGFWTAITILAETDGFALIHNIKQLVSYAGLDVKLAQSGTWKGKSRISKQGNKHIRKSLYFSALSKSTHDPGTKEYYQKLKERKGIPMVALVAVQRKLLALIYTLWKKQEMFDPLVA